jgi:signal transduction histidine kinase
VFRDHAFLFSILPASPAQQRFIRIVLVLMIATFVVVLPYRETQWARTEAFIPVLDTLLFLIDLITAVLLFAQFAITHSRALLGLACGYLFTACIIIPHLLTFPGAFSDTGLLGAEFETSAWLYALWHLGLPVATIAYATLRDGRHRLLADPGKVRSTIMLTSGATVALVIMLTWTLISVQVNLPDLMFDDMRVNTSVSGMIAAVIVALSGAAIFAIWRRRSSMVDVWLMVVLTGWVTEVSLLGMTNGRFTVVWYVGRLIGLFASTLVLGLLISESTKLYSRLAIAAAGRARDREGKRMTLEVLIESIAHEVHQPLSAVIVNSDAALRLLEKYPLDLQEVRAALADISSEGHRAGQIIDSMRAVLAGSHNAAPICIEELVHESLLLLHTELEAHDVSLLLEADPNLPFVRGDRGRLLQVLVNLEMNALESMQSVNDRVRRLRVRSTLDGTSGVAISVEDSGTGIAPEHVSRVFDPFFSTKPRRAGLGLAICRAIVDAHGGKISLTSGSAGGSAFHVVLPST